MYRLLLTFSYQHAGGIDDGAAGPTDGRPSSALPQQLESRKINILIHIDVFYARLFIRDPQVVNLDQRPKNFRD